MTVWGYCRISTDMQDNESQRLEIAEYASRNGMADINWRQEIISSRKTDRDLYRLLSILKRGDVVLTTEFSRLARGGMIELSDIVGRIRAAGADLIVIRGEHKIKAAGELGIQEQAILFAFSIASQIERDMIRERTKAGMKARKEAGYMRDGEYKPAGRKEGYRKLDGKKQEILDLMKIGVTKKAIAERYEVSRVTLDRFLI